MIGIDRTVAKYTSLSVLITDNLRSVCLYGNIPGWRFMASNGKICLYLSRLAEVKQLKYSVKTVLQRGRILSRFIRHKQLIISLINE